MSNIKYYPIKRWDAILKPKSIKKTPLIYIKPDDDLIEFIEKNEGKISVFITGTNSPYDNKKIYGISQPSSNVPNPKPNFYDKTKLYVVELSCDWYEYPRENGNVIFFGSKNIVSKEELRDTKKDDDKYMDLSKKINPYEILFYLILLIIILILIFIIIKK